MMAKPDFDVFRGSDFQEKPIEGISTCASIWHEARVPVKRKCLEASSYLTGSPVDFPVNLKLIRAGVPIASSAGKRGWSITSTFLISTANDIPSALKVRLPAGAGTVQKSPDSEIGG